MSILYYEHVSRPYCTYNPRYHCNFQLLYFKLSWYPCRTPKWYCTLVENHWSNDVFVPQEASLYWVRPLTSLSQYCQHWLSKVLQKIFSSGLSGDDKNWTWNLLHIKKTHCQEATGLHLFLLVALCLWNKYFNFEKCS